MKFQFSVFWSAARAKTFLIKKIVLQAGGILGLLELFYLVLYGGVVYSSSTLIVL